MRPRIPLLLLLGPLTLAPRASASPADAITLSWEAPDGCPERQFVLARVSELVGDGAPPDIQVAVLARIEPAEAGFRLWLETTEGTSHWRQGLEDASCAELAEAASVVIALVVGGDAPAESQTLAPAPEGSVSAAASASTATADAAELDGEPVLQAWGPGVRPLARRTSILRPGQAAPVAPKAPLDGEPAEQPSKVANPRESAGLASRAGWRRPSSTGWFLQAGGIGDWGSLPKFALGLEVRGGVEGSGGRRLELGAAFFPDTRADASAIYGVGGEFRLSVATVAGCQGTADGQAHLETSAELCVGAEVGQLRAKGIGGDWSELQRELWLAARADGGGELRLGRVALVVGAGVAVPMLRNEYVMDNSGFVHRSSWLVGRLTSALRYRF